MPTSSAELVAVGTAIEFVVTVETDSVESVEFVATEYEVVEIVEKFV